MKELAGDKETSRPPVASLPEWRRLLLPGLFLLVALALALITNFYRWPGAVSSLPGQPPLMLWAWEAPTDLRFINSRKTGIAYLAGTISLQGDSLLVKPRLQPLFFPAGAYMMAVIRVETSHSRHAALSGTQVQELSLAVLRLAMAQRVRSLQIDFDARQNEREFYSRFLSDLRKRMPTGMPLSMTSLSSWCLRDTWISGMPCEEVVPMFFCMGAARAEAIELLSARTGLARMPMQESLGLSVDEPDVLKSLDRLSEHVYLFSPHGWNNEHSIKWVKAFEAGDGRWKQL